MSHNYKIIDKPNLNMVKGFHTNGVEAHIKVTGRRDVGMILCDKVCDTFATYTTNQVKSAHITVCKEHLQDNKAQAIIVNSGYANACTGQNGINDAREITKKVGAAFNIPSENVLVGSTGEIGKRINLERYDVAVDLLKKCIYDENDNNFTKAIMTTDTKQKFAGIDAGSYKIIGTAKGSGMIHPNMATMLAYIVTDAKIEPTLLNKAFRENIEKSFNSVTVDGDTSTNDTAIIMASGMAENDTIKEETSSEYETFKAALKEVMTGLAKQIAADGEGATKFITIDVINAASEAEAKTIGMSIAHSPLTKTAMFGEDANWGRIMCAAGYSGIEFDFTKATLRFSDLKVFEHGEPTGFSEEEAKKILQQDAIHITLDMARGDKNWTVWTCDFSFDYVKINADYRT